VFGKSLKGQLEPMSYHILHQFDETLLDEITGPDLALEEAQLFEALSLRHRRRMQERVFIRPSGRELFSIGLAIVIAIVSLIYSAQAQRRASDLQKRLTVVESELKRH
jgi:hypothetical protein